MVNPRTNEDINGAYAVNLIYWQRQLQGAPSLIILPANYSRNQANDVDQCRIHFDISRQLRDNFIAFCEQYSISLPSFLLAAYNILLYRYTSQADIVIGVPCYNGEGQERNSYSHDELVILPFRTDLSGDLNFCQLIGRVCETLVATYEHRKIRNEDLVNIYTDEQESWFTSTMFSFKKISSENDGEQNGIFSVDATATIPETQDLWLSIESSVGGLSAVFTFNQLVYDAEFIFRMSEHFKILLNGILAAPGEIIGRLPLLADDEIVKLTVEWNDTYTDYPRTKCIHQLFEEQVLLTPSAIAVQPYEIGRPSSFSTVKRVLTFQELNERANQLANFLIHHGVGPEVVVGIFMKRSTEMLVAIMGILKAGAAYLPIDPAQPRSRLDFMLKDSGVPILITQYQLMHKLPPHEIELVCLDADWNRVGRYNDQAPVTNVTPENLAYIIYTSGTTGNPKGTLIIHRGVVNYLSWCTKAYNVNEGTGAPVNTSLGFDATVTSLLAPLMVGKKVLLLPEENEVEILAELLTSSHQFSLVKITPAHLSILNSLTSYTGLQEKSTAIVVGGEALNREAIQLLRKQAPTARIFNEYGPTETVVGCSVYEVGSVETLTEDIPIGRPISNTHIYILDDRLQHLPIGIAGEIFIGGDGVARGYLNRPELTAEKFLPDPFIDAPGAMVYRTGDIARFLKDGNIMMIGRRDDQVKIRGYRIELKEIISVLKQYPGVQEAVVIVHELPGIDKRIIGYLVFIKESVFSPEDIRDFLASRLPEYMIPSEFVRIEAVPLTINGKLDKASLPMHIHTRTDLEKVYKSPETNLEKELTILFEQALHINRVGVSDNLFELGIHSLQVYWVFAQIKKTTSIQLPLSILFQNPTVEKLAAYLGKKECNELWSSLVPIQPKGSQLPLFCIHGGGGTVLFYRDLAKNLGDDQPVYGLQPQGLDGKKSFHGNIEQMAAHYIKAIQTVNPTGPYMLAGYCFGAVVAFEMAQQLEERGFKVSLLVSLNGISPTYVEVTALKQKDVVTGNQEIHQVSKANQLLLIFSWRYFREQSLTGKMQYLSTKLANKIFGIIRHKVFGKISRVYTMGVYLSCQKFGLKCPESLRKFYFLSINSKMVKDYKPNEYTGVLTIIRSPGLYGDPDLGWTCFVRGEIRTIDIPGKHKDRRQILNEPFVQLTAKALQNEIIKCTEQAV